MDTSIFLIIEILLLLVGLAGTIIPGLPGIPLAYAAILIQHFNKNQANYPPILLIAIGLIVLLVVVLQYFIPSWSAKQTGASKFAVWGSFIGLLFGLFTSYLGPLGLIFGPFIGAVGGELLFAKKSMNESLKAGLAAALGIIASSFVELIFTLGIVAIFILSLV